MIRVFILAVLFFLSCAQFTYCAQQEAVTEINFESASQDSAGQRLCYQVKEVIRKSQSLALSKDNSPRLTLHISTMDKDDRFPGTATIYTIYWTVPSSTPFPYLLNSTMGYVGSSKLQDVAEEIVAQTDDMITQLRKSGSK